MDTASDSAGERKPVCHCAPKSSVQHWLPGLPIVLCLLMSLSSVTVCLLMSFKTFELENRLQMETRKASIFEPPHRAFLNEDGTLIPELAAPIGEFMEEVGCRCFISSSIRTAELSISPLVLLRVKRAQKLGTQSLQLMCLTFLAIFPLCNCFLIRVIK